MESNVFLAGDDMAWMKKATISSGGSSAVYDDGDLILRFILEECFSE